MASRAILRRKRFIDQYLNASTSLIPSSHSLLRGAATENPTSPPTSPSHGTASFRRAEPLYLSGLGPDTRRFSFYGVASSVPRDFVSEFNAPIGVRWMVSSSQSLRRVSTAAAKQPEPGSDDNEGNDETVARKRKEASPEECDQAVEGLTTAKAKAKAQRLQESQKDEQSVLQRVWAAFLGIGPALRAVASMSRLVEIIDIVLHNGFKFPVVMPLL